MLKAQPKFSKPAYEGDHLLRADQVAAICNVRRPTVYKWWQAGVLPVVNAGGVRMSWQSDVLSAIQPNTAA
jgi:hypothetical protein